MLADLIVYGVITGVLVIIGIYRCRTHEIDFLDESGYPLLIATWTGVWLFEMILMRAWRLS